MGEFFSSAIDSIADTAFNPLNWPNYLMQGHKEGQARDEARQIRKEDTDRAERWHAEEMRLADSGKVSSIGGQAPVGMDTGYLNMSGGQNYMTASDRALARENIALVRAQREGVELDNIKKAQAINPNKTGQGEAGDNFLPGGGQVVRGRIIEKPMERTTSYPGKPSMEPGAIVGGGFEVTPTGLAPLPSSDAKNRMEDSPYEMRHFYRYGILPNFGDVSTAPPQEAFKRFGNYKYLYWNHAKQEWQGTNEPPYELADKSYAQLRANGYWTTGWENKGGRPQGSYLNYKPGKVWKWNTWKGGK